MIYSVFLQVCHINAFKQAMTSSLLILHYDDCQTTTQNRESQWTSDREAPATNGQPRRLRQTYSIILKKYLAQNSITMSHLFPILLFRNDFHTFVHKNITRKFRKSSLGCDPWFENPFSNITQHDKCITRNYALKQPNINFNVAVATFLQSHRSVHRKILNTLIRDTLK